MVEVPSWAIAAFGIFTTALLGILGYLLRTVIGSIKDQGSETKQALEKQGKETKEALADLKASTEANERRVSDELARIDKRFVEEQLAQTRMFVGQEAWTRDYVTLSQRMEGMHRRIDRVERDQRDSHRRLRADSDIPEG